MPAYSDLPILYGDSSGLYPLKLTLSFSTLVSPMRNGGQQRSVMRYPLIKVDFTPALLTREQKELYKAVFVDAKGQMNTTMTIALFGNTFGNLSFTSDSIAATENRPTQYSVPISLVQTMTQNLAAGLTPQAHGGNFQSLSNNAMGQLPYTQRVRFASDVAQCESGLKYTWGWYGTGVANCPTGGLYSWDFDERELSDADLAIRMGHFIANWGRMYTFPFVDEDGSNHSNCHYASDDMVITLIEPDKSSVKTSIEEVWGNGVF